MAMISPTTTYAIAIFQLNILASNITEARSTSGEDMRNENVTPSGKPAFVNPIKIGMDEQEQNGVTVPNNAPNVFATIPLIKFALFSLVKRMIECKKPKISTPIKG